MIDRSQLPMGTGSFFKAAASDSANGCVEIAYLPDGGVALGDTKDPGSPVHVFTAYEWACFLDGARKGEFDPKP
jgi:hypothetical protein